MAETQAPSAARGLLAQALVARGATRLATGLFLGVAAAALVLAVLVWSSPAVSRPGDSREGLLLSVLVGAAAAMATWGGTALSRAKALARADRALALGGLFEAAVQGADRPGPFQALLEGEVRRRVRLRSLRASLEQPWGLALLGALAALWCLFAAVDGARRKGAEEDRRRLLGRAAQALAAAAAGDGAGQDMDLDLARLARQAESAARTTGSEGPAELESMRRELAELARTLDPTDPAAERVESARLALGDAPSRGDEPGAAPPSEAGAGPDAAEFDRPPGGGAGADVAGTAADAAGAARPGGGVRGAGRPADAAPSTRPNGPPDAVGGFSERAALAAPPRAGRLAQEAALVAAWVARGAAAGPPR